MKPGIIIFNAVMLAAFMGIIALAVLCLYAIGTGHSV